MTYNVFIGTLNPTQSIKPSSVVCLSVTVVSPAKNRDAVWDLQSGGSAQGSMY